MSKLLCYLLEVSARYLCQFGDTTSHFHYFLITGISFGTEVFIAVRHNYPLSSVLNVGT